MAKRCFFYLLILIFLCFALYFVFTNQKAGEYKYRAENYTLLFLGKLEFISNKIIDFIQESIIKQIKNILNKIFSKLERFIKEKLDILKAKVYIDLSEYNYSYTRYNARSQTKQ